MSEYTYYWEEIIIFSPANINKSTSCVYTFITKVVKYVQTYYHNWFYLIRCIQIKTIRHQLGKCDIKLLKLEASQRIRSSLCVILETHLCHLTLLRLLSMLMNPSESVKEGNRAKNSCFSGREHSLCLI